MGEEAGSKAEPNTWWYRLVAEPSLRLVSKPSLEWMVEAGSRAEPGADGGGW